MKKEYLIALFRGSVFGYLTFLFIFFNSCTSAVEQKDDFSFFSEQFADIKILRYQVPGFDELNLSQKKLVYYLTQAGLEGRDIMYDQNYRHNVSIRTALEKIYQNYKGDKSLDNWKSFETYLKRIWFSNGIHHHYSNDKHDPGFSSNYLEKLLNETNTNLEKEAFDVIFNDEDSKKVNLDASKGLIKGSAVNFYGPNVTVEDVENYYSKIKVPNSDKPISLGLNSKLVKENGKLVEKVWKLNGMYSEEIENIIYWLSKASEFAENEKQKKGFDLLIKYYETGDLNIWDEYNVAWVETIEGDVDYINGFIEVYNDPKGYRGSYESVVQIKDFEMSKKMDDVSNNAQWFEDNSPIMKSHKKDSVVGISYNTVNVAGEAGDSSPSTPIGINLPNANWIRVMHGSKSVSLGNILYAYGNAGSSGRLNEFAFSELEIELEKKYGENAGNLHTALHEVIGHASGKINDGIGTTKETLKSYASALEEARADLVGLYFISDKKLEEIGISPSAKDMGRASYDGYIRNGLITQLIRIKLGDDIEESHMRNRQLVSSWAYEKGLKDNVIEKVKRDKKTFYVINDYKKLRILFGDLLREIQRIKSEGDFEAGKNLIENYGVKVDQEIHKEVLERNKKFTSAPYSGFINPELVLIKNNDGEIIDVKVTQPESFSSQMLNYSKTY
ncbi:MAG: dihydrofolate reductase [Flavobacteriaceae bacterium]|nr:dihydrofolate reductase [Flavobacteriaceae bacterium]MBT5857672.1 dihydrofolate reductase [Flavobacteriaceae bacterium]